MDGLKGMHTGAALWANADGERKTEKSAEYKALSERIDRLSSGGGPERGAKDGGEDTVTVQRTMPDGSILIVVMQGDKVISETKTPAPQKQPAPSQPFDPREQAAAPSSLYDRFNDTSTSRVAGTLFNDLT